MENKKIGYLIGRIALFVTEKSKNVEITDLQLGFSEAISGVSPDYKEIVESVKEIALDISDSDNVDKLINSITDLAVPEEGENFFTEIGEFASIVDGFVKQLKESKKAKKSAKKAK